jgi:hypothetical protein
MVHEQALTRTAEMHYRVSNRSWGWEDPLRGTGDYGNRHCEAEPPNSRLC